MKILFCLLLSMFCSGVCFSQTSNAYADSCVIPFTLSENKIIITVLVNGTPRNFMLDIGASGAGRIDERIVKEMKLDTVGYEDNSDGVNTSKLPLIRLKELKVGNTTLKNADLMSRNYNRTKRDTLIDGLIGRGFFEDYLLTIDYPGRKIIFKKGKLDPKGKNVLTYVNAFRVKGKLGGKEYEFFLDTGSNMNFHFPEKVIQHLDHDTTGERSKARRANTEFALHGVVVKEKFQLGSIKMDGLTGFYSAPQTWINVGGIFLKSYKITIDQKNKCLVIE